MKKAWGTGMIARSSTFRPHPGRFIRNLFRLLYAVQHGTEALVYINHPRDAAASLYMAIIFGRIASGVPLFLHSTAMNRFTLAIVTLGTIRPEDSGAVRNATRVSALNCIAKPNSPAVWACLGVNPLDMPRAPYRVSEGKGSQ